MSHILPRSDSQLVTIGQAANVLGVSIDTIRRWDKKGKLSSVRLDGKNRYFSIVELQNLKENLPMTVSEAASNLGISASTLRRYEKKGIIGSSRSEKGDRLYSSSDVEAISKLLKTPKKRVVAEEKKVTTAPGQEVVVPKTPKEVVSERRWSDPLSGSSAREINIRISLPKLPTPSKKSLAILASIVLILLASFQDSRKDSNVLAAQSGFNLRDVVGIVLSYIGTVSENIVNQYKYVFVPGSIQEGLVTIEEKLVTADLPDGVAILDANGVISGLRITGANILSGAISAVHIATDAVTTSEIKNEGVMGEDIAPDAIGNSELADSSVESANIRDNTIEASDLATILTFSDGDYLDLSGITYSSTSQMGLRLPNTSSATPSNPSSGEGFLAYDATGNQVLVYDGLNWTTIGGSVTLATGGGLEYISDQLSLSNDCDSGQLLKWNGSSWGCGNDTGGAGGGITTIEKGNVNTVTSAASLDFSSDFNISLDTGEGENEADITIDYTTSKITRTDQTQSITGGWTFSNLTVSDTGVAFSGGDTTFDVTGAATRTLTLLNSTTSQVANLNLSDGVLQTGGTTRLDNSGNLTNVGNITGASGITITSTTNALSLDSGSGTVSIAAGDAIGNGTWSIASTGLASGLSANDLTGCTNCIGATEVDESTIASTSLSDGANIAHINVDETVSGGWTFSNLTVSDTNVTISGGDTTLDITGAATRTLTLLNSTVSQAADLNLSDGSLFTGGTSRLTNGGALQNITGLTVSSGSVSLPADTIDPTEINDNGAVLGVSQDELCLTYENTGGYFEWQSCGSGGGGISTVRESDAIPSVGSLTTLEFGPATTSEDEFVVTDQTGGVARIVLGSKVAHINATESVSGAWTFSNLTVSDTNIGLSGGSTTLDLANASDTILDIANSSTGVAKLRIDSLTNGGAGCDTIDTTADGTLVCGSDAGGAGGGIATVRESDASPSYGTLTTLEFGPATTSEDDFIVTNPSAGVARITMGSKIAHINAGEIVTGGWTFNTAATTFTTGIVVNGGASTAAGTALTLATGNNGAGTAGNIAMDVGTSTSGNGSITIGGTNAGSIAIGRATVTTTVNGTLASSGVLLTGGSINGTTIGASTTSTGAFTSLSSTGVTALGNNSTTVAIDGTNFDLSTGGVVTLVGGQTSDITTAVSAGLGAAMTLKPGLSTGASSNGGLVTISGGDGSGTTTVTGGGLTLTAGSATGASGTRTGGNVTINAGDGATNDGIITIGSANSRQINLGNATNNTTLTLTGSGLTTLGGDLQVTGGTFTGADSDAIEVGSVSNTVSFTLGAASEYTFNTTAFTLGADNSIGNGTWSIASTGLASGLSANDLTGCTDCIGATEVDESGITSTSLSDGANIAHINASEAISATWTFGGNGASITVGDGTGDYLSFAEYDAAPTCSAGDYFIWARSGTTNKLQKCQNGTVSDLDTTGGGGGTLQQAYDTASGNTITTSDGRDLTITLSEVTTPTSVEIFNSDTAGVVGLEIDNTIASGTLTNGLLVEQSGAGAMTNGLHVLGSAGTIADGLHIEDGAGAITDAIQLTGTFTNLINSTNFTVTNAGAITGVGVNSGSGQIQGTGGLSVTGTTSVNVNASTNTTAIGTGTTSGAITIGGGSNTITIATTSWDVSSDGSFSGLNTLGLTGAITGATATNTINGIIINSGAVSSVSTLSASGTTTIGSGGNTFTFDPASGPLYAGTAMPTKRITLTPEYAGGSLTGDGTSNTGTMTSDNDKTASSYRNYYNWTTAQGTSQDYDIWIKVPLPADFGSMTSTDSITVEAWSDTLANTTAQIVQVYDTGNTADCTTVVDIEPGSPSTWTDKTTDQGCTGGTYAANGIMTIQLRLGSVSNANVRVGRIYINYEAKF